MQKPWLRLWVLAKSSPRSRAGNGSMVWRGGWLQTLVSSWYQESICIFLKKEKDKQAPLSAGRGWNARSGSFSALRALYWELCQPCLRHLQLPVSPWEGRTSCRSLGNALLPSFLAGRCSSWTFWGISCINDISQIVIKDDKFWHSEWFVEETMKTANCSVYDLLTGYWWRWPQALLCWMEQTSPVLLSPLNLMDMCWPTAAWRLTQSKSSP